MTGRGLERLSRAAHIKSAEETAIRRGNPMQNVGTVDRILRLVVGAGLVALVFFGPKTPWGWVGVIPLLTAILGYCPAYSLFGIRTCPLQKE